MSRRRHLRPADLAKAHGVSTQYVRNLIDEGVLPAAERGPQGYRILTPRHAEALSTFLALKRAYGRLPAAAIMAKAVTGNVAAALELVDGGHGHVHQLRLQIEIFAEALHHLDTTSRRVKLETQVEISTAAAQLAVRPSALRTWEKARLLVPARDPATGYRYYSSADLHEARAVITLRQCGYSLEQIRPVIDQLRGTGGSAELARAIVDRRAALTRTSEAMLHADASLAGYLRMSDATAAV